MTTYKFPPEDKTLYGLTTGNVYKPVADLWWMAGEGYRTLNGLATAEPDGVTDVRPVKVGETISTVEELDALRDGTLLRNVNETWEKLGGSFFTIANEDEFTSTDLADGDVFTILWLPETGEQA